MGWVARYRSPSGEAAVRLVTRDATAPHDSVVSVHVGASVDEAYAEAKRRGYEIVHPLTEEAWGLRRFFVRVPDGNVITMVSHGDDGAPGGTSIIVNMAPAGRRLTRCGRRAPPTR